MGQLLMNSDQLPKRVVKLKFLESWPILPQNLMVAVHLRGVLWDLFDFYICLRVDLIDLQNFITKCWSKRVTDLQKTNEALLFIQYLLTPAWFLWISTKCMDGNNGGC